MFRKGDKVISLKYGAGTVSGPSSAAGGVLVSFQDHEHYDCVYNAITGARHPKCGTDHITLNEEVKQ